MAGYSSAGARSIPFVDTKLQDRKVMLFTKKHSPECKVARDILAEYNMDGKTYEICEIESRQDVTQIENYFQIVCLTDSRSVPQLFVNKRHIGGEKEIPRLHENGELRKILSIAGAV